MTLQLIVKGNASEAQVACDYNGITVISVIGHPRFNETIIRADDRFEHDAQKWFVASGIYDDRKPAPIGTLLWYGTIFDRTMHDEVPHEQIRRMNEHAKSAFAKGNWVTETLDP